MSQLQLNFTCAIALNNMGVHLVERHCYRQAMETFNATIAVLKGMVATEEEGAPSQISASDVQTKLRHAYRRVANLQPDYARDKKQSPPIEFCVITEGQYPVFLESTGATPADKDNSYLSRIDTLLTTSCFDIESAVILHNHGQACRCFAMCCFSSNEGLLRRFQELSYMTLQIAYDVVQCHCAEQQELQQDSSDFELMYRAFPLCILLLQILVPLSGALDRESDTEMFSDCLQQMQQSATTSSPEIATGDYHVMAPAA
jgi:hypothetical protein